MPKTRLRAGLIVIEAWFRGYRGSLGLGGIRTAGLYTSSGLLKREDTRQDSGLCPAGTPLCVEDKLGDPDIVFPSL